MNLPTSSLRTLALSIVDELCARELDHDIEASSALDEIQWQSYNG